MKNTQGAFVLENKMGQVVRTIEWQDDVPMSMIYRTDTRRVEPVRSTEELDEQDIPYVCLVEVTRAEVQKKAVKISQIGVLRWVDEVEGLSPSVVVPEENNDDYKKALKWVGGVNLAIILLLLLIGHFVQKDVTPPEEPQVVTLVPRKHETKVVAPMEHKHKVTEVAKHKVTPRRVPKNVRTVQMKIPKRAPVKHPQYALNQVGALSVLGSLKTGPHDGGLNLNAVKSSRGPGLGGGTEGSGGIQTSLYSKGLVGAPLGPGAHAEGLGGYGTHGRGGGQAGYGSMSLIGSSNAYFEPVEKEAEVDGGLDREQIAAVIQRHLGQIRYCYEQGLQLKPELAGRVGIKFFIGSDGMVRTADVVNTSLHSGEVEGCIASRLKTWKFPMPRGGVIVKVTYPFVLKRVSQS